MKTIQEFQTAIGYEFKNESLLRQALTHSSYANEKHMKKLSDNERLEFLGDAVLETVSSEFLFLNYQDLPEGDLTRLRASMVCEPTLAYCTKEIDLGDYIYLGKGEDMTGGRERKSVLSDAMEAVIGAIFLDGGFDAAKSFILKYIMTDMLVRVCVFNPGEVIPKESLDKIWTKFYKVDKARTREYGGSGIGLSIVKAIMESHHRAYGVVNHDNGVEFWFELELFIANNK